jgi:3-O-methylgallate 3,4-dioxygenase
VGVVGSGGLSHFVVDEALDRHVLAILAKKDAEAIAALPATQLDSGNSEIRNWIAAAGAAEHLEMELVDYVPSYRSEAGTGVGMGFAVWC